MYDYGYMPGSPNYPTFQPCILPKWEPCIVPLCSSFVPTVTTTLAEYNDLRAERDMLAERVTELEDRIAASLSALCPDGDDEEEGDEA